MPASFPASMPFHSIQRWLSSGSPWATTSGGRPRGFGGGRGGRALSEARLDFADALIDLRYSASAPALDRIALARSLDELWNYREEIFALVAHRHDQSEAARRMATLDRHFSARPRPGRLAAEARAG